MRGLLAKACDHRTSKLNDIIAKACHYKIDKQANRIQIVS